MDLAFDLCQSRPTEEFGLHPKSGGASSGLWLFLLCTVFDGKHRDFPTSFDYRVEVTDSGSHEVALRSVHVGHHPRDMGIFRPSALSVAKIRDLPLARWESAARGYIALLLADKVATDALIENRFSGLLLREDELSGAPEALAEELVRSMHPDIDKDTTPSGLRRARSLRSMARAAVSYKIHLASGRTDPSAEIAREMKVSPSTARSWIHRARAAGFLGAASGRTAGEASVIPPTMTGLNLATVQTFLPANDAERQLRDAVRTGGKEQVWKALLDATVVLPLLDYVKKVPDLMSPEFPWPVTMVDGMPHTLVFTSVQTYADAVNFETGNELWVKAADIVKAWPDESLSLGINARSGIGMSIPGSTVLATQALLAAEAPKESVVREKFWREIRWLPARVAVSPAVA